MVKLKKCKRCGVEYEDSFDNFVAYSTICKGSVNGKKTSSICKACRNKAIRDKRAKDKLEIEEQRKYMGTEEKLKNSNKTTKWSKMIATMNQEEICRILIHSYLEVNSLKALESEFGNKFNCYFAYLKNRKEYLEKNHPELYKQFRDKVEENRHNKIMAKAVKSSVSKFEMGLLDRLPKVIKYSALNSWAAHKNFTISGNELVALCRAKDIRVIKLNG